MLITLFAVLLLIAALWLIGSREPAYRLNASKPAWFVALKDGDAPELGPEVRIAWRSVADFAFIGAGDAYWTRFFIVHTDGAPPRFTDPRIKDAFVARIRLFTPPKVAMGLLRVLVALGVLSRPKGVVATDTSHLGHRADLMPNSSAIDRLLSQRPTYAPAMVNFLRYTENGGATAYRKYGMVALRTVYRTGGVLLFYARVVETVREAIGGPTRGAWNDLAAMRYPDPSAILAMEHLPAYRAALHHRDAGLAATVVIASHEASPGPETSPAQS